MSGPQSPFTFPRGIDPNSYEGRKMREDAEYAERSTRWAEEAKVLRPERCLWAWRYWFKWNASVWEREQQLKLGKVPCPVDLLPPHVGGWTFCGRRTLRVGSMREADRCTAAGIEWHVYENEPADARRVEKRMVPAEEQPEFLSAASLSLHAPTPEATCGKCLVSCDLMAEHGHIVEEERLGEVALRLRPFPDRPFTEPKAWWWKDGLYLPDQVRLG